MSITMHGHIISSSGMSVSPSGFVFFFYQTFLYFRVVSGPSWRKPLVFRPCADGRRSTTGKYLRRKKHTYIFIKKKTTTENLIENDRALAIGSGARPVPENVGTPRSETRPGSWCVTGKIIVGRAKQTDFRPETTPAGSVANAFGAAPVRVSAMSRTTASAA